MEKVRVTKTEWLLLGLTAVFLCVLLALSWQDRSAGPEVTVETAVQASPEEVMPEFPPLDLNTLRRRSWRHFPASVRRWRSGS